MTPFIMVIFGATGDLAQSKLLPSLLSLYKQKKLGEKFFIIGFSRRDYADEDFRNFFNDLRNDADWENFSKNLYFQKGNFDEPEGYKNLYDRLQEIDKEMGACITRFFYFATPPGNYEKILSEMIRTKLNESCGPESDQLTKIVIEKPFGKDLETAKALDKKLSEVFNEDQIFRVDHYLGKETVQNMIAFRFANGIFEPVWKKDYIDHVQITFAEKEGVGERGMFFDGVGILRDVAQNHLLQLVAAVAMRQPQSFSKEGVRDARAEAINSIRPIEPAQVSENVVRGQYKEYRKEEEVKPDSNTETFVAMKFFVDNPRFEGVPFYVRAGKKMPKDVVEINIVFIQTCHLLFKEYGCPEIGNVLTIRIQPNEGIGIRVIAKKPGDKLSLGTVNMDFSYQEEFGGKGADAYEKVLMDIFAGDQMLFNRSDELESSWEFITKILEGWKKDDKIASYSEGEWGPRQAQDLIEKDGKKWL